MFTYMLLSLTECCVDLDSHNICIYYVMYMYVCHVTLYFKKRTPSDPSYNLYDGIVNRTQIAGIGHQSIKQLSEIAVISYILFNK